MNRIISLFLFIFIASCLNGQYNSPIRNKVTLGKQTTADGLVWRGLTSDTANLMTNKLDTSVYLVLDTMTEAMWLYRVTTTPKWNRVVDSLNNMQGQLSLTTKVTGTLAVANGGTGATSFSPNNYLIRTNSSGVFDTSAIFEAGGNVGIGTASPTARLHVKGSGATNGTSGLKVDNSSGTNLLNILDNGIATFRNISNSGAPATSGATVIATLSIDNYNSVMTNIGNFSDSPYGVWLQVQDKGNLATTYPLSLQPNAGNVGIGTASPLAKLHVDGTGRFTGSITSTAVNSIISTGGSSILSSQYTGTNGNWFTFQNAGGVHYVGIDNSAGTDFGATAYSMLFYTPSTRNIEFLSPAGKRMVIASGGAVTINNLAGINDVGADANGKLQAATSDINLKNTIEDSPFGLNEILLLNPVTFLYNDENRKIDSDVKEVGFIAQDVFDIIPNAVSSTGTGDLQLDYRAITATLVKAIQEQNALIKALEQRILTLENK